MGSKALKRNYARQAGPENLAHVVQSQAACGTHALQLVPGREHWKNLAEISLIAMLACGKWIKLMPSVGGGTWGYNEFDYTAA